MKISETFSGDYLKASDIPSPVVLVISSVFKSKLRDPQTGQESEKPIISFATGQQLVMNKTNANIIAELYGDDTNGWHNRPIEIYPTTTEMRGKMVPCIRVRQPQQQPAAPAPQPAQPQVQQPVQQPAPATQVQPSPPQPPVAPATDYPLDA